MIIIWVRFLTRNKVLYPTYLKKINIMYPMRVNFKYFSISYFMSQSVLTILVIFYYKFLSQYEFSSPILAWHRVFLESTCGSVNRVLYSSKYYISIQCGQFERTVLSEYHNSAVFKFMSFDRQIDLWLKCADIEWILYAINSHSLCNI